MEGSGLSKLCKWPKAHTSVYRDPWSRQRFESWSHPCIRQSRRGVRCFSSACRRYARFYIQTFHTLTENEAHKWCRAASKKTNTHKTSSLRRSREPTVQPVMAFKMTTPTPRPDAGFWLVINLLSTTTLACKTSTHWISEVQGHKFVGVPHRAHLPSRRSHLASQARSQGNNPPPGKTVGPLSRLLRWTLHALTLFELRAASSAIQSPVNLRPTTMGLPSVSMARFKAAGPWQIADTIFPEFQNNNMAISSNFSRTH